MPKIFKAKVFFLYKVLENIKITEKASEGVK